MQMPHTALIISQSLEKVKRFFAEIVYKCIFFLSQTASAAFSVVEKAALCLEKQVYLWETPQMLSAYSAMERSAAKIPERATLCRLMVFH